MDLTSLRSLVRSINFETHGVDATIEPGAGQAFDPFVTRAIWLTPETEDQPRSLELHRRERSYVLAIPFVEIPARGAIVLAPRPAFDEFHGEIERWEVDGFDRVDADHVRLRLVLAPLETT